MATKYVLCMCVSMGCARQRTWDEPSSTYVNGAWVARTTSYNHKRLDERLTALNDSLTNDQQSADSIILSTFSYDSRIHAASREQPMDSLQSMTARVTAEVGSVPTSDASAALEEDMDNLVHLAKCVNQRILSFSTQAPLMFAKPPDILSEPYSNMSSHLTDPNTGLYELDSQASVNVDLLVHEQYIFRALLAVRALPGTESLDEPRQKILDRVIGELQRINLIRGREWDHQLMLRKTGKEIHQQPCRQRQDGFIFIDAGVSHILR
jgi:hypothetical protein